MVRVTVAACVEVVCIPIQGLFNLIYHRAIPNMGFHEPWIGIEIKGTLESAEKDSSENEVSEKIIRLITYQLL